MKGIQVLTTFHQFGNDLGKFITKQKRLLAYLLARF
jgi:hypothetical protein